MIQPEKRDITNVYIKKPLDLKKEELMRKRALLLAAQKQQGTLTNLGGKPSADKRSQSERNKDYLNNPLNPERLKRSTEQLGQMVRPIVGSAAIASGAYEVPATAGIVAKGLATLGKGALQGLGFGALGMGTGSTVGDINAGLTAEIALPVVSKITPYISELLNKNGRNIKQMYYQEAPWTWKPDPNKYYRAGSKDMINDAINTGVISAPNKKTLWEIAINEGRIPTLSEKLDRGSAAGNNVYFSKGEPLSSKFSSMYKSNRGSNYGDYIIETASKNMKEIGAKGKNLPTVIIGDAIKFGHNATPIEQLNTSDVNLLKPNWFYGYKKYQKGGKLITKYL